MGVRLLWQACDAKKKSRSLLKLGEESYRCTQRSIKIGIDTSCWLIEALHQSDDADEAMLKLHARLLTLLKAPFQPLFVLDGPQRPKVKRGHQVAGYSIALQDRFLKLLDIYGMTALKAKGEAEVALIQLAIYEVIDMILTTDSDALLLGLPLDGDPPLSSDVVIVRDSFALDFYQTDKPAFSTYVERAKDWLRLPQDIYSAKLVADIFSNRIAATIFAAITGGDFARGLAHDLGKRDVPFCVDLANSIAQNYRSQLKDTQERNTQSISGGELLARTRTLDMIREAIVVALERRHGISVRAFSEEATSPLRPDIQQLYLLPVFSPEADIEAARKSLEWPYVPLTSSIISNIEELLGDAKRYAVVFERSVKDVVIAATAHAILRIRIVRAQARQSLPQPQRELIFRKSLDREELVYIREEAATSSRSCNILLRRQADLPRDSRSIPSRRLSGASQKNNRQYMSPSIDLQKPNQISTCLYNNC
ncbi:uncharacterized protein L969DRAFT_547345 [Mixia osmundae IAM 14324]|uniref:XPG-I domain-containing protein n=1 Tax=Mixia osmundae (strain CBS 9802 / IAM 14324 / JCM 22182 / KY 12970) TaxID=764103 RepID=G7E810_MIXOS|nr:uncharacterized protein L969DRAFT_547345 [Mixia osmundae IAM 14324]KEI38569.1 hypothetical protein L969DRAFT_547345 [Mixia osmundae IAM 14324]GAA98970.1 hypothetical protein E5Q_05658 [Mixia osmundae IAM 14324]